MNLIETGDHQINANRDPDLRSHSVLAGAKECFDAQVLLDPFKEEFDLPSTFVDRSDAKSGEIKVIGQEYETLPRFSIKIADASQSLRVVTFTFISPHPNALIATQPGRFIDWARLHDIEPSIALGSDNKIRLRRLNPEQSGEVEISAVEDIDASRFEADLIHEVDIMHRTVSNPHKHRNWTSQVDLSVEFDCRLSFTEVCPRKHRQAQIDRRGIYGIDDLVQIQSVGIIDIQAAGFTDQYLSEGFVYSPVSFLVRVGQIGSGDITSNAHRVEVRAAPQTGFNVSKALSESYLRESHSEKLISGSHTLARSRHWMKCHTAIELLAMDEIGDLSKNGTASVHSLLRMNQPTVCQHPQMRHMPNSLLAA